MEGPSCLMPPKSSLKGDWGPINTHYILYIYIYIYIYMGLFIFKGPPSQGAPHHFPNDLTLDFGEKNVVG